MRLIYPVLVLLGTAFSASPGFACSCKKMTREQVIAATPVVFEGRVLRVRKDGNSIYADVETARVLKGSVPRVVEVGTNASSVACGYTFRVGDTLTVGASLSQMQYSTNMCTMVPLNSGRR